MVKRVIDFHQITRTRVIFMKIMKNSRVLGVYEKTWIFHENFSNPSLFSETGGPLERPARMGTVARADRSCMRSGRQVCPAIATWSCKYLSPPYCAPSNFHRRVRNVTVHGNMQQGKHRKTQENRGWRARRSCEVLSISYCLPFNFYRRVRNVTVHENS